MISIIIRLNRISRHYRYVMRVLAREKIQLKVRIIGEIILKGAFINCLLIISSEKARFWQWPPSTKYEMDSTVSILGDVWGRLEIA